MTTITTTRSIAAEPAVVFEAVAKIETFQTIQPGITNVVFLTDSRTGVGTRFEETRIMGGREATTTLEVTEYDPPNSVRLVAEEGGTTWDTVFTVEPKEEGSLLTMVMDAQPHTTKAKAVTPLIKPMIAKAVGKDMDHVKAWCEGGA
ncbi:MAG: hypothetical protein HKN94_13620 [Acidimicrobiales bacterium]|nr:hypothetical protein [Acidimicrobiales bacterium]